MNAVLSEPVLMELFALYSAKLGWEWTQPSAGRCGEQTAPKFPVCRNERKQGATVDVYVGDGVAAKRLRGWLNEITHRGKGN